MTSNNLPPLHAMTLALGCWLGSGREEQTVHSRRRFDAKWSACANGAGTGRSGRRAR